MLYANDKYTLSERLAAVEGRWNNPYPASYGTVGGQPWDEYIICGHNPYLVATLDAGLKLTASNFNIV